MVNEVSLIDFARLHHSASPESTRERAESLVIRSPVWVIETVVLK